MLCARVDIGGESQLLDAVEALEIGVLHDIVEHLIGYRDESEDRIVDDFSLIDCQGGRCLLSFFPVLCATEHASLIDRAAQFQTSVFLEGDLAVIEVAALGVEE